MCKKLEFRPFFAILKGPVNQQQLSVTNTWLPSHISLHHPLVNARPEKRASRSPDESAVAPGHSPRQPASQEPGVIARTRWSGGEGSLGETSVGLRGPARPGADGRVSRRLATRRTARPGPPWLGGWSPALALGAGGPSAVRSRRRAGGHASCARGP